MRKLLLFKLFIISLISTSFAQLSYDFDVRIFYTPSGESFCEYYFLVERTSLSPIKNAEGFLEAGVFVTAQNASLTDTTYKETLIMAPPRQDTASTGVFLGMLRCVNPKAKTFASQIILSDYYGKAIDTVDMSIENIGLLDTTIQISNIVLSDTLLATTNINDFSKSGYDVIPKLNNYFPEYKQSLSYYAEFYNSLSQGEEKLLILSSIINRKTKKNAGSFRQIQKITPDTIIPLIGSFGIAMLPSGEYELLLEVKNKTNETVCSKSIPFTRSNNAISIPQERLTAQAIKISFIGNTSYEDVLEYTKSLRPIASNDERNFIDFLRKNEVDSIRLKSFFLEFWLKREYNQPDVAWQNYHAQVKIAEQNFSSNIKRGYETDRGRVFLEYGPPNHRTEVPSEPSSYPYEIWQYYKAKNRNNIRFIFYNKDLVSNDYELLHSDMRGEPRNVNWEQVLRSRNNQDPNFENQMQDEFGGRSKNYYNNPR